MAVTASTRDTKLFIGCMLFLIIVFGAIFLSDPTGDQASIFFWKTRYYLADMYDIIVYVSQLDPYKYSEAAPADRERAWPALAYLVYYPLSLLSVNQTMMAAVAAFAMFVASAWFFITLHEYNEGKRLTRALTTLTLMLSFPFICVYERGNIGVILTAALCAFFLFNYENADPKVREVALVALAITAGLKGFPLVLGLMLVFNNRYREALRLGAYAIVFVFIPFLFVKGGISSIPIWIKNLKANADYYGFSDTPRLNFRYWFEWIPNYDSASLRWLYIIMVVLNISLVVVALVAAYRQQQVWKRATLLLLVVVLFPVNSQLYVGNFLLPGMVLFLNDRDHGRRDWIYVLLMVLILNPLQFNIIDVLDSDLVVGRADALSLTVLLANFSCYVLLGLLAVDSFKTAMDRGERRGHEPRLSSFNKTSEPVIPT